MGDQAQEEIRPQSLEVCASSTGDCGASDTPTLCQCHSRYRWLKFSPATASFRSSFWRCNIALLCLTRDFGWLQGLPDFSLQVNVPTPISVFEIEQRLCRDLSLCPDSILCAPAHTPLEEVRHLRPEVRSPQPFSIAVLPLRSSRQFVCYGRTLLSRAQR